MVPDPPFTNLIQGSDCNEHDAFEGHGKETLPACSRILPSPILFKKVTMIENSCTLDDFLVAKSPIKWNIMALWGRGIFMPVGQVESECSTAFRSRRTPLFSRGEEVDLLFLATIEKVCLRISNIPRRKYNLSLSKSDPLYSFCNTLSYRIRECLNHLYNFGMNNKSDNFAFVLS